MELIFFLGAIIFIAYVLICRILNFLDNTAISNGILAYTDQDEELIKSVTDVNRGTNAEKNLIAALLKLEYIQRQYFMIYIYREVTVNFPKLI